ncbi:MAG: hypothetical protein JNL38_33925 [Myxococcales bacterium]|jgi:hypothetical protein|nr:hypothetical protein [Myxococcales bacterium]
MGARIDWEKGGHAEVVSVSNDAIVLVSTIPSPPGSRIDGAVAGVAGGRVRVKVHSSKKQPDGSFVIEGRPLDLGRALREALAGSPSNGGD